MGIKEKEEQKKKKRQRITHHKFQMTTLDFISIAIAS